MSPDEELLQDRSITLSEQLSDGGWRVVLSCGREHRGHRLTIVPFVEMVAPILVIDLTLEDR